MSLSTIARRLAITASVVAIALGLLGNPAHAQSLDAMTGEELPAAHLVQQLPADSAVPSERGETLTLLSRLADGETRGMDLVGNILYRSNGGYLETLDVSNPEAPVVLGRFLVDEAVVTGVAVVGDYAYVSAQRPNVFQTRGSLQIVDVSDPANPVGVGAITGRSFFDVQAVGTTVYGAALGGGLRIIDASNPASPTELGFVTVSGGSVLGVAVDGSTAYVAAGGQGLRAIDVSDATTPTIVGSFSVDLDPELSEFATDVVVADGYAYISVQPLGLVVVDVSDPTEPVLAGYYVVEDEGNHQIRSVAVVDETVYLGKDNGFIALDVSDFENITRLGTLEFGVPGSGQSIIIDGDTAWVGNRYHGTRVIDVSDPTQMTHETLIHNGGFSFKVTVVDDIVYVADLIGQLRLIDISDPTTPVIVGRLTGLSNPYRLDVVGNVVYLAHQAGIDGPGGHVTRVDVSDPTNPTIIDQTPMPTAANSVHVVGDVAFLASGTSGTGAGSVEALDTASMEVLDSADAGNTAFDIRVADGTAYIATFGSGLTILDVSNPSNIVPLNMAEVGAFSTGVEVDGHLVYMSDNSFGPEGLRVVDVSNPVAPETVGTGNIISGGTPVDVAYHHNHAYVTVDFVGVYQYDVSDPTNVVSTVDVVTSDRAVGVDTEGTLVVVVDAGAGVWIFEAPGAVSAEDGARPDALLIEGAYPNPFSADATVRYRLPESGHVSVTVHDILGREVARLVDGAQPAGVHEATVAGAGMASGVYFVRISAGGESVVRQVTLVR